MAPSLFTTYVLVVALALGWAGGERAEAESAPVVTLRTLITGTCQEIQRYAESIVGTGPIRSTCEVTQRGGAPLDITHFLSAPGSGFHPQIFSLIFNLF